MSVEGFISSELNGDLASDAAAAAHDEAHQCWECNTTFEAIDDFYDHLKRHVRQPIVQLHRAHLPPLKITFKQNASNSFEIVTSPGGAGRESPAPQPEGAPPADGGGKGEPADEEDGYHSGGLTASEEGGAFDEAPPEAPPEEPTVDFSAEEHDFEVEELQPEEAEGEREAEEAPQAYFDMPKIRIKSGLMPESATVREVGEEEERDPLKISDSEEFLSLISNNEKAKDFGFTTSDSDFFPANEGGSMALCNQFAGRNLKALAAGLPMEALAQQVSRLHANNGMHQQNVLINIQQFPQAPPNQQPYPPIPLHHYPQHPQQQPMYPPGYPYQYARPNSYYPPPQHYPLPQPPMPPPPSYAPQPQYRPRQPPPLLHQGVRMAQSTNRMMPPSARPPAPSLHQLQQRQRVRQPMGGARPAPTPILRGHLQPHRQMAPRTSGSLPVRPPAAGNAKRTMEQMNAPIKRMKKCDFVSPDKDDDDCEVICMQPRNKDGALPQIESVQGGTGEGPDSNVMHLSDSITLSVRNPPPPQATPKKSDPSAVANILATRGITVTAKPKPQTKTHPASAAISALPPALNLNGAVSIIPKANASKQPNEPGLPTVDLTDDRQAPKQRRAGAPAPAARQLKALPFKCDLCPAHYPTASSLSNHRQNYHKTLGGTCELGVPLISLNQKGVFQRLSRLGIHNYIPMQAPGQDGMYGLPIINARSNRNAAVALGAASILALGPVRSIPRAVPAPGAPPTQK